jgi:exodeoxyribonuclease VII small subunit
MRGIWWRGRAGGAKEVKRIADVDLNLEEALSDLERIVGALEDGKLSLEESLDLFERGIKLVRLCSLRLDKAEQRVESLTGELPRDLDNNRS